MRKIAFSALVISLFGISANAQNTFTNNGTNVGIGTTNPSAKLDVNGHMKIDSTLIVKDSVRFKDKLTIDQDLKVLGKTILVDDVKAKNELKILGTTKMKGDAFVEGSFKFKNLADPTILDDRLLIINKNGKVRDLSLSEITDIIYDPPTPCKTDINGNTIPVWKSVAGLPGILYTGGNCEVRVGIGIANPDVPLHVIGDAKIAGVLKVGTNSIFLGGVSQAGNNSIFATGDLEIQSDPANDFNTIINANNNGNVGIGIINPANKLEVAGTIRACKLIAEANSWCDFVFEDSYELMSIKEVEDYINLNGHLPNIPSEEKILANGVDVVDMEARLLRKIEELTLYIILLKKENDEIKSIINTKE